MAADGACCWPHVAEPQLTHCSCLKVNLCVGARGVGGGALMSMRAW